MRSFTRDAELLPSGAFGLKLARACQLELDTDDVRPLTSVARMNVYDTVQRQSRMSRPARRAVARCPPPSLVFSASSTLLKFGFDSARVRLSTLQTAPVVRRDPVELQHAG